MRLDFNQELGYYHVDQAVVKLTPVQEIPKDNLIYFVFEARYPVR